MTALAGNITAAETKSRNCGAAFILTLRIDLSMRLRGVLAGST
eukprot:CAMPEP_0178999366 /NCGR_PEP_ID=MMETSP0795-20121207/10016_1 /TAXON_ID=88552 /ORGANISM="Amoebophrya sp., Strain Ameob2" /LENGTH=42 /DNA_ID= /DNA_START= /DNA_END= /DNA_ORIENTATION=